ncbi:MAG: reverse transcriptase domain-containing protein, partial [Bacteroidota bacterium]
MGLRGNLPIFIKNFLSNRKFCVGIGASHSSFYNQEEGLPQGSVLSVTCFAVAINDIVKQVSNDVQCTLYVDDFTIFISSRNEAHSSRVIQTSINRINEWTKSKGFKLSAEKTAAIKFEKRKKGMDPELTLNNNAIQVLESTRYLGLIVDKRLSWKHHIEHLRIHCTPGVNLLKHLSHLSWGADRKTLELLYSALVKSKLDYGAHIYGATNSKILKRLDPIQNSCLRACTGAFKSSPTTSLHIESGTLPLKYAREVISLRYFFKAHTLPDTPT